VRGVVAAERGVGQGLKRRVVVAVGALLIAAALSPLARAEDGYDLWLRYRPLAAERREAVARVSAGIVSPAQISATLTAAVAELETGIAGMTAREVPVSPTVMDGALVIGTPRSSPLIAQLDLPLRWTINGARAGRSGTTVI
jgi:alpha-glucuronidase